MVEPGGDLHSPSISSWLCIECVVYIRFMSVFVSGFSTVWHNGSYLQNGYY